jgi:tRNA 2-thiocytidine biosynthesis protein TtcA
VIKELELDQDSLNCFWCSWNKRKMLFKAARQYNCNKLALGHNLDDITETILMNICFFAEVSSSPPSLEMFGGDIRLIRPLCYLQKREILEFASCFDFPDMHYECPYGISSRRQFMKEIIKTLEKDCPGVKKNIFRSLRKIRQDYLV